MSIIAKLLRSSKGTVALPAAAQRLFYEQDVKPHRDSPAGLLAAAAWLDPALRARMVTDRRAAISAVLVVRDDITFDELDTVTSGRSPRPTLRAALGSDRADVRAYAIAALGPNGLTAPQHGTTVRKQLVAASRHHDVLTAVVTAAGAAKDPTTVQQLCTSGPAQLATLLTLTAAVAGRTDVTAPVPRCWIAALEGLASRAYDVYIDDPERHTDLQPVVALLNHHGIDHPFPRQAPAPTQPPTQWPLPRLRSRPLRGDQADEALTLLLDRLGDDPSRWALLDTLATSWEGTFADLAAAAAELGVPGRDGPTTDG